MRQLFFVFFALSMLCLNSCDDGDIITFELDFEDTFEVCDGGDDLVFYKTKDDPSESLSLKLNNVNLSDILIVDADTSVFDKIYTISTTNPFNYRTYSNTTLPSDLFCNAIPNSDVKIKEDIESTSGSATLRTVLVEDDDDGIPAELEDINGNGDLEDDDTDGDGLPNYIDADDDGDNVLTKNEDHDDTDLNVDSNGDGDPTNDRNGDGDPTNDDTDGDGIPDYLDTDDDGDGTLTRNEEKGTPDQVLENDITNPEIGPDYLNDLVDDNLEATKYREHTISQTYTVTLIISNFDLEFISQDVFDFGVLDDGNTTSTRNITPDFN